MTEEQACRKVLCLFSARVIPCAGDTRERDGVSALASLYGNPDMTLTIPATIAECVRRGRIKRFAADLLDVGEEQRVWLYGTPNFLAWYRETLPTLATAADCEISPLEEVESFFRVLMLKKRASGQLARLQPTKHGVWEAKPYQTRLFGWFPEPMHLIFVSGTPTGIVKDPNGLGYDPFRQQVLDVRKRLKIGFIGGDITHALATARHP